MGVSPMRLRLEPRLHGRGVHATEEMMNKVAVVTGAGSGVGRAIVIALARDGWNVALIGRTESTLRETIAQASSNSKLVAYPGDVSDESFVSRLAGQITGDLGEVDVLVNNAGTNIPRRSLEQLSVHDFKHLIDVNLTGAFLLTHALLPSMRNRKRGTIVNVISDAGLFANRGSGAAYIASKFGMTGLTGAINAEERRSGIRACGIYPGEINTPILDKRPAPPTAEAREKMLQPEDVAACVMLAINLPERAVVEQLLIRPR
jgi:NAD(P)-dependent dehydrogenase (short-subunit alcohol dehydrogenase family)